MMANHTGLGNPVFRNSAASLAGRLRQEGVGHAQAQAFDRMYRSIQNQAATLSYIDAFWILGVAAGVMFLLSFMLRKNDPRGPRGQVLAH